MRRALLVVVVCTFAGAALAQPVNAEIMRKTRSDSGWSGEARGSVALRSGNVNLLDLGAGVQLQFLTLHEDSEDVFHRFFVRGDARQADRSGDRFVNNAFAHARWTAMWIPRVGSELFVQVQFNEFLRLNTRLLTGGGVRVALLLTGPFTLSYGTSYMSELEAIEVQPGALDEPQTIAHRWSNYMTGSARLFEGAVLGQATVYAQPRFDDPQDLRILQDYELAFKVTEHLAFGTSLRLLFDSRPPTGVENSDVSFSTNLRVGF